MARRIDLGRVIGPQGPQGEQGPQGPQGEQGPEGPVPENVVRKGEQINLGVGSTGNKALVFNGGDGHEITIRPTGSPSIGLDFILDNDASKSFLIMNFSNGKRVVVSMADVIRGSAFAEVGMPSDSVIEYSGDEWTSGHVFTAPFNGWLVLSKCATDANQYIEAGRSGSLIQYSRSVSAGNYVGIVVPMRKSSTTTIKFDLAGIWGLIRFIKAQAEV